MDDTEHLDLQIGNSLQLQVAADELQHRHYAKIIGYLRDCSFMITMPRVDGNVMLLRQDQLVKVRMMAGNQVCGFSTLILCVRLKPYPYLHLAYPNQIEQVTIRKAQRVSTELPATVSSESGQTVSDCSVMIQDLSASGSMIVADQVLGDTGSSFALTTTLNVAGRKDTVVVRSIIRNIIVDEEHQKFKYGLEFLPLAEKAHFVLNGYVYEQLILKMKK